MTTSGEAAGRKLVLVDAYSLLFRAFFVATELTTSRGEPTGGLFGLTNMMTAMMRSEKPDAVVVCWDAHEQTLRSQEYAEYKANRSEPDPRLRAQMPVARELVAALGLQSAELGGYEADDLVGTLARRGREAGFTVVIMTGDTDQLQLVDEQTVVQMKQTGVAGARLYDLAAVRERYGIEPGRIPDWKALVGDTSDNIPGVPGIGSKTATALLQRWECLEDILENLSDVTPARAQANLTAGAEQARQSKRLATIDCNAPIDLEIEKFAPTPQHTAELRALFERLEFKSMLAKMGAEVASAEPDDSARTPFEPAITVIRSENDWQHAVKELEGCESLALAADYHRHDDGRYEIRGMALAANDASAWYVALHHGTPPAGGTDLFGAGGSNTGGFSISAAVAAPLLCAGGKALIGAQVKSVLLALRAAGLTEPTFTLDVVVAAYLLEAGKTSYPLADIAAKYLNAEFAEEPTPEGMARSAALLFALAAPLRKGIEAVQMEQILDEIEMPLIPILANLEAAGILIDMDYLGPLADRIEARIAALAVEIYEIAGERFDIGSTKQLQSILFGKLQIPSGKKTKTGLSTGAELLEQLAPQYEICRKVLDWREVAKLKTTYTDALKKLADPETRRVHTSLNQTRAITGRLSSSDPNLQNIPVRTEMGRQIRRAFIAAPGHQLLSCDYSQIELRLLAHITEEPALLSAFGNDEDVHAATAATMFGVPLEEVTDDQRRQAKTVNFAVIYGQSPFGLAGTLGIDRATATRWISAYFERLPGLKQFSEELSQQAHRNKFVSTLLGRRRYLPELDSPNFSVRQFAERAAVNMPIQGTAADIIKLAMLHVDRWLRESAEEACVMLLQVHDELLFEIRTGHEERLAGKIRDTMESAFQLKVPLKADVKVGPNWADMTSVARTT